MQIIRPFQKGDKIHYVIERFDYKENGIVKSVDRTGTVFAVYKCDGNWDNYENFTAQGSSIESIRHGWVEDAVNAKDTINQNKNENNI